MASLALPSLEVQRFRGFQDLRIGKLGRVNLIVGKNNIGKSSLLEAIQLYATRAYPSFLWQILAAHDEDPKQYHWQTFEEALPAIKYLFFGRKEIAGPTDPIKIGPLDNLEQQLKISIDFYTVKGDVLTWQILLPEEYNTAENPTPRFSISFGKTFTTSYSLDTPYQQNVANHARLLRAGAKGINLISIDVNGLNKQTIARLWDRITLTDHEEEVLKALRIIAPGIEAINIVSNAQSTRGERTPIVKVQGIPEPLPIRTLGDGMQRTLSIALALINAQNGILLIDEIENGLHYSVQEDLWRLVFQIAHRLNIQVFATTHSWDCITGFQKAAQAEENEESVLIRLEYKKDVISAKIFDERKIAIATREQIEVR
jgi:ABC-type cobalamin/Fe3+-siderophores transport system ATPase subunit